jgi:5-dehydro-4-deoxyglucarate dehydratase
VKPAELKQVLESGLLSFPLTDFDAQLKFAPKPYAQRLEWLMPYGASALFAAGGTGEFFSLEPGEYSQVIKLAVDTCRGRMPIIGAAGAGTMLATQYATETERAGAQGLLLLPHYLTEASQEGLFNHVQSICKSVKLGVIVYNRGAARYAPETLAKLADACPNFIGYKDGVGDIEHFVSVRRTLGDRVAYLGGLPTAEVFAGAYKAMGCPVYSSAVFNFIPKTAIEFYNAHAANDTKDHQPHHRRVLPAVHRDPQQGSRLRGEHRQGGRHDCRPQCRPGSSPAVGAEAQGSRRAACADRQARPPDASHAGEEEAARDGVTCPIPTWMERDR